MTTSEERDLEHFLDVIDNTGVLSEWTDSG